MTRSRKRNDCMHECRRIGCGDGDGDSRRGLSREGNCDRVGCRQPATPNPSKVCFEEFWKLLNALSQSSCTSTAAGSAFRPHTQPG